LLLVALNREDEAVTYYENALSLYPQMHESLMQMGHYHLRHNALDKACDYYSRAIEVRPYSGEYRNAMAMALARMGQWEKSVEQYRWRVRVEPGSLDAVAALAWMLSTVPNDAARDGDAAVRLAQFACQRTDYRNAAYMDVMAAAYAEVGRFDQAVTTAERVLISAKSSGMMEIAQRVEQRLDGYRHGRPHRDPLGK